MWAFFVRCFFHLPLFKWIFSYSPKRASIEDWAIQRAKYRKTSAFAKSSMPSLIERHSALLHFTDHVSASFIFVAIYVLVFSIYSRDYKLLYLLLSFAIIFPGTYSHYKRLSSERYSLETAFLEIEETEEKSVRVYMLEKLSLKEKFWPILALDHGLTVGHDSVPIAKIPSLLKQCEQYIGSVVMHCCPINIHENTKAV